jgi:hypothetical protein
MRGPGCTGTSPGLPRCLRMLMLCKNFASLCLLTPASIEPVVEDDEPMVKCEDCGRSFGESVIARHSVRMVQTVEIEQACSGLYLTACARERVDHPQLPCTPSSPLAGGVPHGVSEPAQGLQLQGPPSGGGGSQAGSGSGEEGQARGRGHRLEL